MVSKLWARKKDPLKGSMILERVFIDNKEWLYVLPGDLERQMQCLSFLCVGMSLGQEENNPKRLSPGDPEQSSVREGSHSLQWMRCPSGGDCSKQSSRKTALMWVTPLKNMCSILHKHLVLIKHLNGVAQNAPHSYTRRDILKQEAQQTQRTQICWHNQGHTKVV